MQLIRNLFFIAFVAVLAISCEKEPVALTDYVNPFIGTGATGHTFPGATLPFVMVQLSPDTRSDGWDNCSGYHSSDPTILGFSHTHLSGTGGIDYGDILVMPMTGKIHLDPGKENNPSSGYRSAFNHSSEKAEPGFYSVMLEDNNILAEMTTTLRCGFHRYTFPRSDSAHILFDLTHGLGDRTTESVITISGPNEITGMRRSSGWAKDQTVYFIAQFSQPFRSEKVYEDNILLEGAATAKGENVKAVLSFGAVPDRPILVRVALSSVDGFGARKNLSAELGNYWDFDGVKEHAQLTWEKELSAIEVEGGNEGEKTNFYTALYHSFIAPNLFMDVDGRYRGNDFKIHTSNFDSKMYSVFSLWDTFRATHPLFTLIKPELAQDLIRSMLTKYDESGLLPVWELAANETGTMIGYHSIPVIVDAWIKGLRNFDENKALDAMVKSAMENTEGLDEYKSRGYIPVESENESVSKTLEYAYDDWCIAVMAEGLGKTELAEKFYKRSKNYLNVYNPKTGFMQGRKFSTWDIPFDPSEVNATFTEANSWQYTFFAPHDMDGLIGAMGGDEAFVHKLDALFTAPSELIGRNQPDITGLIGQYAHGNEPSHNFAYLYNYAGAPWKTQERVKQIMDDLYNPTRAGLSGNEDCGQMSSWYVFSAMGFYPVTPGQDLYAIGSPLFNSVKIRLENGDTFTISAKGRGSYIQSARLNGKKYPYSYIRHSDITGGGSLKLNMGSSPKESWGKEAEHRPPSLVNADYVKNPVISVPSRAFLDSMKLSIASSNNNAVVFYTLDGSNPDTSSMQYIDPIMLKESAAVKAVSTIGILSSNIESVSFVKLPYAMSIDYAIPYNTQYTGGGPKGLFDTIRGHENAWGAWQGWFGDDFNATVDLGEVRDVQSVTATFLQNAVSWIWLPKFVSFEVSEDGETFESIGINKHSVSLKDIEPAIKHFSRSVPKPIRYIRIKATNIKTCPKWHPGAGNPAWIFTDEITIK